MEVRPFFICFGSLSLRSWSSVSDMYCDIVSILIHYCAIGKGAMKLIGRLGEVTVIALMQAQNLAAQTLLRSFGEVGAF